MLMHYRTAEFPHLTFCRFLSVLGEKKPSVLLFFQTMREKLLSSAVTGLGSFLRE